MLLGADDRVCRAAPLDGVRAADGANAAAASALGSLYVPGGGGTGSTALPFAGNLLTSDPVRYARTVAVLEAEPALGIGSPTVAGSTPRSG